MTHAGPRFDTLRAVGRERGHGSAGVTHAGPRFGASTPPAPGQDAAARSAASSSSASHWLIRSPTSHINSWWRLTASSADA